MSRRIAFVIAATVVVLFAGFAAVTADMHDRAMPPSLGESGNALVPVVQTGDLQVSLRQGPKPLCPGFYLYSTLVMTNTSQTDSLTGIVVTDTAPAGTWVHEPDLGGSVPYLYDAETRTIVWNVGDLAPQSVARISYNLRTFSSLSDGTIITHTMQYSATELSGEGLISDTIAIDGSACGPTPTPTSTPTSPPTPTPTLSPTPEGPKGLAHLPVVFR